MLGTLSGNPPVDINNYPYRDISLRIPTTLYIFGFYLWRLIFPFRLLYDYSYNQIPQVSWANPLVWVSLFIVAILIALAIKNLKRKILSPFHNLFWNQHDAGYSFVLYVAV